jgi:hypothetical protein
LGLRTRAKTDQAKTDNECDKPLGPSAAAHLVRPLNRAVQACGRSLWMLYSLVFILEWSRLLTWFNFGQIFFMGPSFHFSTLTWR